MALTALANQRITPQILIEKLNEAPGGVQDSVSGEPPVLLQTAALTARTRSASLARPDGRCQGGQAGPGYRPLQEIQRHPDFVRRTKNNPALISDPGVGKTAVVEGLAQKIVSGDVPGTLKGKRLISLDLTGMIAGTKYRGSSKRIKKVIEGGRQERHHPVHR